MKRNNYGIVKYMKKYLAFFLTIFFFLFIFQTKTYAVRLPFQEKEIPGITCGVAGSADTEACCTKKIDSGGNCKFGLWKALLQNIPLVGKYIENLNKECQKLQDLQDTYGKDLLIKCISGEENTISGKCICTRPDVIVEADKVMSKMCRDRFYGSKGDELSNCLKCTQSVTEKGWWTAIGCIPFGLDKIVEKSFGLAVQFAGGITFLCILFSAFQMLTSSGKPEQIKKSRELLLSCISGLLLIIFSVFILKIIGVDILRIPFNK
jgi:hypothetical protein